MKTKTINLQGKEYAQVKDRILEFREQNPNGLIHTEPIFNGENIMFKARILRDKSDETSAEATGHSIGKNSGLKAFEKLETIAVGRALALLGYASDGEIASSDEMEEFYAHKAEKFMHEVADAKKAIAASNTLQKLQNVWTSLDAKVKKEVEELKDEQKIKLHENTTDTTK